MAKIYEYFEPQAAAQATISTSRDMALYSAAISLKRIADRLEACTNLQQFADGRDYGEFRIDDTRG